MNNLVTNAMTYGAADRPVTVTSGETISVHNFGPPIPPGLLPHIFEPMRRGEQKATARSVGLGLYIVSQIAAAHGGHVTVTSTEEEGTSFVVSLKDHSPG